MKRLQATLCLAAIVLSTATEVLTVIGSIRYFDSFGIPYNAKGYARLLGRLPAGSAVTLPVAVVLLNFNTPGMRFPRCFVLIGALSAVYSSSLPTGTGHNFSHALFEECSDKYGTVIFWLGALQGVLLPLACLIDQRSAISSSEAGPAV
jgi:hypothetical protein